MALLEPRSGLLAKVCGMTCAADVDAALAAHADFVGFVSFAPSPRHLTDAQVQALCAPLEGGRPTGVLVTVDRPRRDVERLLARCALAGVQLCGKERAADWVGASFLILRRVPAGVGAIKEMEAWDGVADAFVLDHPAAPGGTGERVLLAQVLPAVAAGPVILAGGLGPDLLERGLDVALLGAGLLGVDASSGLESSSGRKSALSIHRFVSAAHSTQRVNP